MKKFLAHVFMAVVFCILGVVFLMMDHPPSTFDKIVAIVFFALMLGAAVAAPLHEVIVSTTGNAKLLSDGVGAFMRLGRRNTDTVAEVVPPVAEAPKDGSV